MHRSQRLEPLRNYLPNDEAQPRRKMTREEFDRVMRHWGAALTGAAEGEARRQQKPSP